MPVDCNSLLKQVNKRLTLHFIDGQNMTVQIISVHCEEGEIVYDLLETNMPERYEHLEVSAAYLAKIDELTSFEVLP